ncbi:PREDICTED: uncharacterized protein LOC106330365 [Brassica oleracea var. oleracea]|nr:PREDICTED: uncharacterized protein LOC106330365 [Brassica oleracea var. oleracea]
MQEAQRQALTLPSPQTFEDENRARASWMFFAAAEESFLHQKSRVRWLNVGDLNTGVFHKAVRANLSRNVIHYLLYELDRRVFDSSALKDMIIQYYLSLLGTENQDISPFSVAQIQEIHPFRCSDDLAAQMSAIPTDEEIRKTIFSLPKSKSPGPDGFSVEFFLSSWDLVGGDLIKAVKDFFLNPDLSHQVNSTVLALLPKVPGASRLSEYRPISLCNTVYKVISKIIGSRLKLITPLAVQRNQVGFITGRLLCENVLLASELVSDFNKPGDVTRGCLQIDITKAYDNVDWQFVLNILDAFELPELLIQWIRSCVTSPHYSVAFNGELIGFFPGKKGLRQGDPISSSLFVLAMDILSKKLDRAAQSRQFGIHHWCSYPLITHLSFADDMLIFFDGSTASLGVIIQLLNEFHSGSGLCLNLAKTGLFVDGANHTVSREMAASFGLSQGSLPVRYLGLPLMPHKLRPHDYQPLIDRVTKKIKSWTLRNLSFAGRLQLIQSVLYGSLWVAWVKHNIIGDRLLWDADFSNSGSWLWRGLMNLRPLARPFLSCFVQSGDTALFWHDNWTGLGPLLEITGANGPRVSGISALSSVSEAIRDGEWTLTRGRHRIIQLLRACLQIQPPDLIAEADDYFLWNTSPNTVPGQFSASKTWEALHPSPPTVPWYNSIWFKQGIPKHAFHAWVSVRNRLPTRDRLLRWGMSVPSTCLLCGVADETRDHIYLSCTFSKDIWDSFFGQGGFNQPYGFADVIRWMHHSTPPGKLRTICKLIAQAVFYAIWNEKNKRLHTSVARPLQLITKEIKIILKAKLYGMDQNIRNNNRLNSIRHNTIDTYLHSWFQHFSL